MQWEELMKIGLEEPDAHLHSVLKTIGVNECCSLVYTVSIICVLQHDAHGRRAGNSNAKNMKPVNYCLKWYIHYITFCIEIL